MARASQSGGANAAKRAGRAPPLPRGSRSVCPVACALDIFGDRWTMLVVRDLAFGKSRFGDLARSPEGIATNILAERLARLEARGLVERVAAPEHAGRHTYRLTDAGRSLAPILDAIADWGLASIPGTAALLRKR